MVDSDACASGVIAIMSAQLDDPARIAPPDDGIPEYYADLARERIKDQLFSDRGGLNGLDIDHVLCRFIDYGLEESIGDEWQRFRSACAAKDIMELGEIMLRALNRHAEGWLDSRQGQERIEELAANLYHDDCEED